MISHMIVGLILYAFLWGVMILGQWIDGNIGQVIFWLGFMLSTCIWLMIIRIFRVFLIDTYVAILHNVIQRVKAQ